MPLRPGATHEDIAALVLRNEARINALEAKDAPKKAAFAPKAKTPAKKKTAKG